MDSESQEFAEATTPSWWLVTQFEAKDSQGAGEVRGILDGARSTAATEPGLKQYVVATDLDDPASTWVLEEWATQADAERHEAAAGEGAGVRRLHSLLATPFSPAHLIVATSTKAGTDRDGAC